MAQSWLEWRELRRQEAGFDDQGGGRRSVDGRGRAGKRWLEFSLNDNFCFSDQHRNLRGAFCFWGGGEGEPIGIECQRKQVRMSGPSELRR